MVWRRGLWNVALPTPGRLSVAVDNKEVIIEYPALHIITLVRT